MDNVSLKNSTDYRDWSRTLMFRESDLVSEFNPKPAFLIGLPSVFDVTVKDVMDFQHDRNKAVSKKVVKRGR